MAGALLVVLTGVTSTAAADRLNYKKGAFLEQGDTLRVTIGFRELFDEKLRQRMLSGFPTTVVMRIYLYKQQGGKPVAFAARTLKAVYDLWDERFLFQLQEPHRQYKTRFREQRKVVDRLTSLWHFPLARLDKIKRGTQYFVAVIAEVNPMSEDLLEEVRRWLRNPYSEHRQASSGSSFFGSFVSIFVNNKIRSAEKTLQLRTQPFYRNP